MRITKPILVAVLLMSALTSVTLGAPPAAPEVWTTDSSGNQKGMFVMEDDDVFVMGSGFAPSADVTIHVYDLGDGYEDTILATSSVTTNSDGSIPVTLVWPKPLRPGYKLVTWEEYYIWVDVNQNDKHDDGDIFEAFIVVWHMGNRWWSQRHAVPEPEPEPEPEPGTCPNGTCPYR